MECGAEFSRQFPTISDAEAFAFPLPADFSEPFPMKKLLLPSLALSWLLGMQLPTAIAASDIVVPPTSSSSELTTPDPYWPASGAFDAKGKTSSWGGFRKKNDERRALFAQEKAADQDSLVLVGDSITEGWHTYKEDLADLHVKVANRGIGGDTTPNLLYRLEDDVLSLHPRALVILIGTNDLGEHTTPKDIAENCKVMLKKIRAEYPKIPIAWCLVMPRKGDDTYPARIKELNTLIEKIAKHDKNITVVDTFTPLALPDGTSIADDFNPDHLHPNANGYKVWRAQLWPILESWHLGQ